MIYRDCENAKGLTEWLLSNSQTVGENRRLITIYQPICRLAKLK